MPTVKAKEFRNLNAADLEQKKAAIEKQLHELRQKKITGQLEKPHQFKMLKRQIAQIHTVAREKKK